MRSPDKETVLKDMVTIAKECLKHPSRRAVWSPELQSYICPETARGKSVALDHRSPSYPSLSKEFKLVFFAAFFGTILFISLCIVLTLTAGREPPELTVEIARGLFSMAQVGFGAIVGLLGGKRLHSQKED